MPRCFLEPSENAFKFNMGATTGALPLTCLKTCYPYLYSVLHGQAHLHLLPKPKHGTLVLNTAAVFDSKVCKCLSAYFLSPYFNHPILREDNINLNHFRARRSYLVWNSSNLHRGYGGYGRNLRVRIRFFCAASRFQGRVLKYRPCFPVPKRV